MTNLIGQTLGRYHILEQLGEGGMATVYKARDMNLNRDVALKVIRAEMFGSAILGRILKRFKREAQALAKLTHPNIVSILDYGEYQGVPYLVMPYFPGGTLKNRVKKPIPYLDAVHLLIPIAQALSHAHELGIIHRDVKPANILITRTGEPMLSDFGIAKLLDDEETRELTGTGVGIGTPEYMAPEQGIGQADERADIYALGIVFYELVTGRIPYRADTPMAILIKKREEPLPRPKIFVPSLPDSVENVLIKALARDPQNRYQTVFEFAKVLERLAHGERITWEIPKSSKPKSIWIWAGIGAIGLIAVCALTITGFVLVQNISLPVSEADVATPLSVSDTVPSPSNIPSQISTDITSSPDPTSEQVSPTAFLGWTATPSPSTRINPIDQSEMIYIPSASLKMGLTSEQAEIVRSTCDQCDAELVDSQIRHDVELDAYWIYKTEISNAMYQRCEQAGVCSPPTKNNSDKRENYYSNPEYGNYPVTYVSWYAAEQYCQWAGGHLPTEAQWEYAARGPNGNMYPWGSQLPSPSLANLADYLGDTEPVDSYPSGVSYFGLNNMTGNVWEWVFDWYQADYYQTNTDWKNPIGPASGDKKDGESLKSGRGGAYWISPGGSNPGLRDFYQAAWTGSAVGFRCTVESP